MSTILTIATIILVGAAIKSGFDYFAVRDKFMKSNETEYSDELVKLRKKFVSSLTPAIICLIGLIFDL